MAKEILLINSDLAKNRGDRAIAEGNIELIKQYYKNAKITGLSQMPKRDSKWYGIEFINMSFQSVNPVDFINLCRQARKSDVVFWGGGEILKDYTNKAALWYWVLKMSIISTFNKNTYGAYQGIGPTKSKISKKLIVFVVRRCKSFIVRDSESKEKLVAWGVPEQKVIDASDPAVLPIPQKPNKDLIKKLQKFHDVDEKFLNNFICIGPRDWFHYKPGGVIPFKYKRRILKILNINQTVNNEKHDTYIENITDAISQLNKSYDTNILFVPMHMDESDSDLCRKLKNSAPNPGKIRILDEDILSPSELRSVIGKAKAMVGFRLHSNIIGISAGVPSINIYYVDKGRVFFDQIKQQKFAMPIEKTLEKRFAVDLLSLFSDLEKDRYEIKESINRSVKKLRKRVSDAFQEITRTP